MKKFFFTILLLSMLTCALSGVYYLIYDKFDLLELKILLTATLTGFFSVTCMSCTLTRKVKNLKFFSNLGLFVNINSYIFFMLLIWYFGDALNFLGYDLWRIIYTILIVCVFFTHGTLMLSIKNRRPAVTNSKTIAVMSSILGTILLLVVLWTGLRELFYLILLAVFGGLYIMGTVLTPFFIPPEFKVKEKKEKKKPEVSPMIEEPVEEPKPQEVEVKPEPIPESTPEVEVIAKSEPEKTNQPKPPEEEPKAENDNPDRIEYLFDELFQRVNKK